MSDIRRRLMAALSYNRRTGIFRWRKSRNGQGQNGGKIAGYVQLGYVVIEVDYVPYKAHRLAWLFIYGEWPVRLDHIDRVKHHNWISNLREASRSQNTANSKTRVDNKTGVRGVSLRKDGAKRYAAYVNRNQKRVHLGCFASLEEAAAARLVSAKSSYKEFFADEG